MARMRRRAMAFVCCSRGNLLRLLTIVFCLAAPAPTLGTETSADNGFALYTDAALSEIAERLNEAIERGMWTPRSNSARALLEQLMAASGGSI